MKKLMYLFLLLFVKCTVILPSIEKNSLKSFNVNELNNKYNIISDTSKNSLIEIKDSIAYFYINSSVLFSMYERKICDFEIYDTLQPIISNCCDSYFWNPKEGKNEIYDCKKWSKGIVVFRGKYSNVIIKNQDTLNCQIIDKFNSQIHSLLFIKSQNQF